MNKIEKSFEALGTRLNILGLSEYTEIDNVFQTAFDYIKKFEAKYSRFQDGSIVFEVNKNKEYYNLDDEMYNFLEHSKKLYNQSNGSFDITVGGLLENWGYGNNKQENINVGFENVIYDKNKLILKNNVCIDFGAFGKGYLIDRVGEIIFPYFEKCVIDFGGDIKTKGEFTVGLENPLNSEEAIGECKINNLAVASSSGQKRVFNSKHHLVKIKDQTPQNDKLALFVQSSSAMKADSYATLFFVSDLDNIYEILSQENGLECLILFPDYSFYKSPGFVGELYFR